MTKITFNRKLIEIEDVQNLISELITKKGWKIEEITMSKEI